MTKSKSDQPKRLDVFAATSYRQVIRERIEEQQGARGYQKRLAEAAGCRPSYISQVLNTHVHLSLDQAAGIADFWGLADDEADYFLCLVGEERSSSAALRRRLQKRASQLRQKHRRIAEHVQATEQSSLAEQAEYYATWYMPAIHVLLGIDAMRTPAALSKHLRLPQPLIERCLAQLVAMRLVTFAKGSYQPSEKSLHLSETSPFISGYHANWRRQAMQSLQEKNPADLHYTGLYALGEREAETIRQLLLDAIVRSRTLTVEAPEETIAVCVSCDFFRF